MENYFDNIEAAIINSRKDIDINIMNTNKKTSKSISFTLSYSPFISKKGENYHILDDKNKKDIKWEKTDNKDDYKESANYFELLPYNTAQPIARSITPSLIR